MKLWLLLLCFFLTASLASGQDIITRTDGVRLEAAIQEIGPTQIRFKLFAQPEGPLYIISTADVQAVEGADGVRRTFSQLTAPPPASVAVDYETGWGRHLLSLSVFRLFNNRITLAYEHIFPSGKIGLWVPVTLGMRRGDENYSSFDGNEAFGTGAGLHFYPHGQGRLRYYVGPAAQVGFFRYNAYSPIPFPTRRTGHVLELKVVNGANYQFTRSFFASADLGLGIRGIYRNEDPYNYYDSYTRFIIPLNLRIGLRF